LGWVSQRVDCGDFAIIDPGTDAADIKRVVDTVFESREVFHVFATYGSAMIFGSTKMTLFDAADCGMAFGGCRARTDSMQAVTAAEPSLMQLLPFI
jgi:hypothetical protein